MSNVSVIDYGVGNIASAVNMIRHVGGEAKVISEPRELDNADKLLLPGVGAFDHGIQSLIDGDWMDSLNKAVLQSQTPILGICLGMQLMCHSSAEGKLKGLSWVDAEVKKFTFEEESKLKIPHMGWNKVNAVRNDAILSGEKEKDERFYFVHSYYVECRNLADVMLTSHHGHDFVAGFQHKNIWGVQFHPEKSHRFGMALFRRFLEV